jgi:hypothetical protein
MKMQKPMRKQFWRAASTALVPQGGSEQQDKIDHVGVLETEKAEIGVYISDRRAANPPRLATTPTRCPLLKSASAVPLLKHDASEDDVKDRALTSSTTLAPPASAS